MYILYINNLIVTSDNLIVDIKNRFYEQESNRTCRYIPLTVL